MLSYADNIKIGEEKRLRLFYRAAVKQELDLLRSKAVGNIVYQAITAVKSRTLYLLPTLPGLGRLTTGIDPRSGLNLADASPPGPCVSAFSGLPVLGCQGTGAGSTVVLKYRPGTWKLYLRNLPGYKAEEVLLHELVHALRGMLGLLRADKPPEELKDYDNVEEFYAILVANIYLSEKKQTVLRGNHRSGKKAVPLPDTADTSAEFLAKPVHHNLVRNLVEQMPSFCRRFQRLPSSVTFNPIGRYLDVREMLLVPQPKLAQAAGTGFPSARRVS